MENTEKKNAEIETTNAESIPAPVVDFAALEKLAETAQSINSFSDYKPGSATATINAEIEEAAANLAHGLARCDTQKQKDDLKAKFESYKKKIVSYYLDYYKNEASCPSVLISGPANFPTRKKAAQNSRRDSLREEYKRLESLKDSLRGGWNMSISSDDPEAADALQRKIEALKKSHALKIAANDYFRKNKTLAGFDGFTPEQQEQASADIAKWQLKIPFPSWNLSNENAEIRRLEERLKALKEQKENTLSGWNFNGGRVEVDTENNRIGVYWDEPKRGADLEEVYKQNKDLYMPRLLWSPRFQRWQCQNNPQNLRRLYGSKTYAPADEESKKAIEESKKARQEAREAEKAEKEQKEAKAAENRKSRAHELQAKQDELKKIGFILKPGQLSFVSNRLADYMKAGHGIRRKIELGNNKLLFVEISYNHAWNDCRENKYICVTIEEAERKETGCAYSGSGFMTCTLKLRDVPESEKRQLATLAKYAEQYHENEAENDARIIALYEAYKAGKLPLVRRYYDMGQELEPTAARAFLESWKPAGEGKKPEQEKPEPMPEEAPKQQQPQEKEPMPTPAIYESFKGEQLSLF